MISGTTVSVELRADTTRDALGNDVEAYAAAQDVDNVIVQPGPTADLDAARPEGVNVALTLHFPKTWTGDLRGARVTLPAPWTWGNPYRVVGNPEPYMDASCPTSWHMPVEVSATDG